MPRHPLLAPTSRSLSSKVFSQLAARARQLEDEGRVVHPLHVGDTYREPPDAARAERVAGMVGVHRYAPTPGEPALLDAVSDRLAALGRRVPTERIQIMSGATAGLSVVVQTLIAPGDEVIIPSPFWPLFRGIVRSRGAVPVEVPIMHRLHELSGAEVEAALEAHVTESTAALYINTPNNPTGAVATREQVDAFVRVARQHDLWLICDEAYQDLYFGEAPEAPVWARDDVQDRYIACHTLSKSYGLAGIRIGYAHGPAEAMAAIRGVQTFTTFCAPRPLQHGAIGALREGGGWLAEARALYGEAARRTADALGVRTPEGGTFLLFDASSYLLPGEEDATGFLERCLDAGVLMTPGSACGTDFTRWARICFTSVPPEPLDDALNRLRGVVGR